MWFDGERQPNTIYAAAVSRGKDSTAMLRAIQIMGWPLDVVYATDVWFDDETPAELPPMVAFKDEWDAKCLEHFGIPVTRVCTMTTADKKHQPFCNPPVVVGGGTSTPTQTNTTPQGTQDASGIKSTDSQLCKERGAETSRPTRLTYTDIFYRPMKKEKRHYGYPRVLGGVVPHAQGHTDSRLSRESGAGANSSAYGFPMRRGNWCTALKQIGFLDSPSRREGRPKIVTYLGIAYDEPIRIAKHLPKKNEVMPLVQIEWDEALCGLIAQYLGMLSPTYKKGTRDGCWFCHNQALDSLRHLRHNYPELWAKLMRIDLDSPVTFHPDGHTVHDLDRRFELEDEGAIPTDRTFRWEMLTQRQMTFALEGNEIRWR